MNQSDPTARARAVYDAIDAFQRTHRLPGLQHAQIRGLLAEHLARVIPLTEHATPPPVDPAAIRAAALREAADAIEAEQVREEATAWAQSDEPDPEVEVEGAVVRARAALLRRMADEEQPATEARAGGAA
ncbi:hypothetical protein [Streptomyces sp. NPDC003395]